MKKWKTFTKEQLEEIFLTSTTFKEVSDKIGYKKPYHKDIIECAEYFNIDYSHLTSKKKEKWQFFSQQEIEDIFQNSISYLEVAKNQDIKQKTIP